MRLALGRPELALSIAGPDGPAPPPVLRPPDPCVDVWRDNGGEVCAYTYPASGRFCMDWPGVARYCFDAQGASVEAWPDCSPRPGAVERVHRRAVVPAALQCLGFETLHASAAAFPSGVIGFVGHPGAGKSTMARACSTAGVRHWADDTLVLAVAPGAIRAVPIPFDVALRQPAQQHFGDGPEGTVFSAGGGPMPLRALVLIDRGSEVLALSAVPPSEVLHRLLPHACTFTMNDAGRRRLMVEQYLRLAADVPVYTLSYPTDFSRIGEVAAFVRLQIAGVAPDPST